MPRRQTERLAYRPRSRGARLSLFHLKLTDSALQALLAYQRLRVAAPRPVIAFQGSQGYLKVPCAAAAGRPEPRTFRFTFYLSRYSKEQPQASFDCVRQSCSRPGGHERLESRGAIQEKITICAAVESSQLPRSVAPEAHSQAPPATWPTLPHQARKPAADPRGKGKASSPLAKKPPTPGASCAQLPVLLQPLEGEPAGAMRLGLQERPQVQAETQERSYKLEEQLLEPPRQEHGPEYTPQQHQEAAQLLQRKQAQQALAGSFLGLPSERFSSSQAGSPLRGVSTWQRHCRSDLTFQRLQPLRAALGPRSKRWQGPHFTGAESSWWGRKMEPVAGSPESSAQSYGNKLPGEGHSTEEAVAAAAEAAAAASNGARESKWPGQTLPPALQGHGSTPAETLSYYL
ncbi:RNA polymerase II elongation factor ELL3 isoform X2 [Rhineura floridana]|nr:RNA polymerase II elongation factor ELL3 isoform X2 [Rhineura floridana]